MFFLKNVHHWLFYMYIKSGTLLLKSLQESLLTHSIKLKLLFQGLQGWTWPRPFPAPATSCVLVFPQRQPPWPPPRWEVQLRNNSAYYVMGLLWRWLWKTPGTECACIIISFSIIALHVLVPLPRRYFIPFFTWLPSFPPWITCPFLREALRISCSQLCPSCYSHNILPFSSSVFTITSL